MCGSGERLGSTMGRVIQVKNICKKERYVSGNHSVSVFLLMLLTCHLICSVSEISLLL